MKKNKKYWLIPIIVSIITFFALTTGLLFYNPFLSPKMVKYYSNDSNFYQYKANIIQVSQKSTGYINIDSIECLSESSSQSLHKNINYCTARIFSPNIELTWDELKPEIGMEIEFYGTFRVFYDGCPAAIIQLSLNGNEILSYNDGKEALVEWAKTVH